MDKRCRNPRIYFLPKPRDENLYGARVIFVIAMPDPFAEFRPRKNAPGFLHQDLQDIELAGRESNEFAGTGDAAVLNVHLQVADLQQVGGAGGGSPAADRFDAS